MSVAELEEVLGLKPPSVPSVGKDRSKRTVRMSGELLGHFYTNIPAGVSVQTCVVFLHLKLSDEHQQHHDGIVAPRPASGPKRIRKETNSGITPASD